MKEYLSGYYCRDTLHLHIVNKESNRNILEALKQSYPVGLDVYELAEKTNLPLKTKAEIYARTVSNFADNAIVTTRIANNVMFANMEALKTIIEHRKDDVKELSRMADEEHLNKHQEMLLIPRHNKEF
jgi:hypothetical protein